MKRILFAALLIVAALLLPAAGHAATLADRTVVLVGDSITGGGILAPGDRLDVRLGYRLCGAYCGQPGYPRVVNDGVGGQQLLGGPAGTNLADTFPADIAGMQPGDTVVINIGMNDLFAYDGDGPWTTAYVALVNEAWAKNLNVLVAQITPIASAQWPHELLRQQLNQWISDRFGGPLTLRYPDVLHNAATGQTWLDPRLDSGDGIHPDAWGTLYMADLIAGKLL